MDELYQVTKNTRNQSHVRKIHPTTRASQAGSPAMRTPQQVNR